MVSIVFMMVALSITICIHTYHGLLISTFTILGKVTKLYFHLGLLTLVTFKI